MKENIVLDKSFALRIVRLYRYLVDEKREFILSKEVLEFGIARRKASETEYWLQLLRHAELISLLEHESLERDRVELIKLISSIFNKSKQNA